MPIIVSNSVVRPKGATTSECGIKEVSVDSVLRLSSQVSVAKKAEIKPLRVVLIMQH